MKAREKRRRRALRQQRKRCEARLCEYWGVSYSELLDCINSNPMRGEVGYIGEIDELLEYPCNCLYCQGETEAPL